MKLYEWISKARHWYEKLLKSLNQERQVFRARFLKQQSTLKTLLAMDVRELIRSCVHEMQLAVSAKEQFRDIKGWPLWFRAMILSLVFAMTLGITATWFWGESFDELRVLETELSMQQAQFRRMAYEISLLENRQERIRIIDDRFGQMLELIPAELEIVQVLDQVNKVTNESGMKLQSFVPDPEIIEEAYATLPITLELSGSFDAAGRFLEAVSRLQHLVTMDVILESKEATPGKLHFTARLKAYRGDLPKKVGQGVAANGGSSASH